MSSTDTFTAVLDLVVGLLAHPVGLSSGFLNGLLAALRKFWRMHPNLTRERLRDVVAGTRSLLGENSRGVRASIHSTILELTGMQHFLKLQLESAKGAFDCCQPPYIFACTHTPMPGADGLIAVVACICDLPAIRRRVLVPIMQRRLLTAEATAHMHMHTRTQTRTYAHMSTCIRRAHQRVCIVCWPLV